MVTPEKAILSKLSPPNRWGLFAKMATLHAALFYSVIYARSHQHQNGCKGMLAKFIREKSGKNQALCSINAGFKTLYNTRMLKSTIFQLNPATASYGAESYSTESYGAKTCGAETLLLFRLWFARCVGNFFAVIQRGFITINDQRNHTTGKTIVVGSFS